MTRYENPSSIEYIHKRKITPPTRENYKDFKVLSRSELYSEAIEKEREGGDNLQLTNKYNNHPLHKI